MKKLLLTLSFGLCFALLSVNATHAQSNFIPDGSSFDEVNNIKIGDDLKPVDNNAEDVSLSDEEQDIQDYIDGQEDERTEGDSLPKDQAQQYIEDKEDALAASEEVLPYNPNAPVFSSPSSGLGSLADKSATDANSVQIGNDLGAIDNRPTDFTLDSAQQAIQDYINEQENALTENEAPLPYDPSKAVSSSGSGLSNLANQALQAATNLSIGDNLLPVSNTSNQTQVQTQTQTPAGIVVQNGTDTLNVENANADSASAAQASISGCSGDVFQQIQCKVLQFLSNLRTLAYVLAGFGLIMFAYAAIFNKVNMKHLSSIGMGLFLLAMMGPFIEYFSGDSRVTTALGYGNFIGDEYTYVQGSGAQAAVDSSQIPDTSVQNNNTARIISGASSSDGTTDSSADTQKNRIKFSVGDVLNFGKSAFNTVKDVTNVAKTIATNKDWSLSNIGGLINTVENTVTGNKNGFDSLANMGTVAYNILAKGDWSQLDVNSELKTGQKAADTIQDLFSSKTTKTENKARREQGENTNKLSNWLGNLGKNINESYDETSATTIDDVVKDIKESNRIADEEYRKAKEEAEKNKE